MSHVMSKAFKIIAILFASFLCFLVISTSANFILTSVERARYLAPGKMVEIEGKRMHIYSEGKGKAKVILLSGFGVPCPMLEYYPLIKALSMDFTTAVIEYYGYGWSDRTNKARTNKNIVEETRLALRMAGILPPYILVPHSISGLYTLYYANTYPDEVAAIIGLDSSVPEPWTHKKSSKLAIYPILRVLGLLRFALFIKPNMIGNTSLDYSDADRRMIRMMACWNLENRTLRNESAEYHQNNRQLEGEIYPTTIPVTMILSKTSIEQVSKGMSGLDWKKMHMNLITGNKEGGITVLEGDHSSIHWNNTKQIASIIKDTIQRKYQPQDQ